MHILFGNIRPINSITATDDIAVKIPGQCFLVALAINPAADTNINIGTTNGGGELTGKNVFCPAGQYTTIDVLAYFETYGGTDIYFTGINSPTQIKIIQLS